MALTRRDLLKRMGTAAAGAAALPLVTRVAAGQEGEGPGAATTLSPGDVDRRWAMVIDLRKCDGCETLEVPPQCTVACNEEHFVPDGQEWIRVFEVEEATGAAHFLPRPCMNCASAPCVQVCPVGASFYDENGTVLIDHQKCIGCRLCMAACPYGARSFNWEEPDNPPGATFARYSPEYPVPHRRGTVEKCMFCAHRLEKGKLPACVEKCPMYAIYFGDVVEDVASNGQEVVKLSRLIEDGHAFRLREGLGTEPRVWYIPGHGEEFGRSHFETALEEGAPDPGLPQGEGHADGHDDER